jgi:ParB family chromosome partitioning protein
LEALLGRSFAGDQTSSPNVAPIYEPQAASSHDSLTSEAPDSSGDLTRSEDGQQWLAIPSIDRNPYQPRQTFDEAEIADLCDSIRAHGFLQSIVVRPCQGRYQLIAGERRLRAAQMAGWERVPVQVRDVDDRQMAELAIVENVQRKDLNAIEKAISFQRYLCEYNCTQEELSARVSIDRSTIANLMRLLELPEAVKQMIAGGDLSAGHGRALLPLGDADEQMSFARRIQKDSMSVRATEQAVADHISRTDDEPLSIVDVDGNYRPSPLQPGQHLRDMEEQLRMALGTKVEIKQSAKGKGRFTIHFASHEEFARLRALLSPSASARSEAV